MKAISKKQLLLLSSLLLLGILFLIVCIGPGNTGANLEPSVLGHINDYPITSDPADMYGQAMAVVIGHYGTLEGTWNRARNPEDPSKESETDYFGARIYTFTVERVIKGAPETSQIRISIPHEIKVHGNIYHPVGTDGKPIKDPVPEPYSFTYIWEYFMEPDPAETYLLFLAYNETRDLYYPAVEPFTVAIDEDGRLELRSNLLLPEAERKERLETPFVTETGRSVTFEVYADEIEDRISGMTLDEFLAELERAAQDPEPVQPE